MKKISTRLLALLLAAFACTTSFAQTIEDDDDDIEVLDLKFNIAPVLVSGTALQVGAKYRFNNIATKTSAFVTIVSATGGATVTNIDDNSLTKPEAFSPAVSVPALSNGLVEFKIEYIATQPNNSNTNNSPTGTSKTLDQVVATAMDIDGSALIKEVDVLNMGGGTLSYFSLANLLEIQVVKVGNVYTATNIAGIEYTGVDTAAKKVMFTITQTNISNFIYKAGVNNISTSSVARQKGIYFKGFNYLVALPVKYHSFTAVPKDNNVALLNWITEDEINHSHFEVERSFDGKNFKSVALVMDGFEDGVRKEYAFKDNSAELKAQSVAYYRLKQFDNNGRFNYSEVRIVRFKGAANVDITVAPNPFVDNVSLRFVAEKAAKGEIRITDQKGALVMVKSTNIAIGYNNITVLNLSNLASGMYITSLYANGQLIASKQIIK